MDYCKAHFGKSINDITLHDVKLYFKTDRYETDQLEFKSINKEGNVNDKFSAIYKSTCAFLNSSGGLLIWGAPIGNKVSGKNEKIFTGDLTFFNIVLEKDFIISKISDSIIPLPNNIRINIIENDKTSLVILEVDGSEYAPHQTSNTYYMRIDGQSKPVPHHYIEALFKRIKYPDIEVYLNFIKIKEFDDEFRLNFELLFFNWSPLINEEKLSFRVISNGMFIGSGIENSESYRLDGSEYFKDNLKSIFYYGEPVREAEILSFKKDKLINPLNITTLYVSVAGKHSPRKISEYILDFNNFDYLNPNKIIVQKKENQLMKDSHFEKGTNKKSILEGIFGKDIL